MAKKGVLGLSPIERLRQLRKLAAERGVRPRQAKPEDRMGYQEPINSPLDQLQDRAFNR
jgi:hypothetical protein